ncbi:hypothetical protein [Burkholderia plantarii]|uniref:hypothetical protein n=1 Tax=Burkholderia plantarii TaxID=41899 RepID=UPI000F4DC908|nr:hypothetical protein [Burkholderia plantarii]
MTLTILHRIASALHRRAGVADAGRNGRGLPAETNSRGNRFVNRLPNRGVSLRRTSVSISVYVILRNSEIEPVLVLLVWKLDFSGTERFSALP